MARLVPLLLITILLFVLTPAQAQEEPSNLHCNVFVQSVPTDSFAPDNPLASLKESKLPEPVFGGCYRTHAEALRVGTNGAISLPDNATSSEIDQAIRQQQAMTLQADNTSANSVILSPVINCS